MDPSGAPATPPKNGAYPCNRRASLLRMCPIFQISNVTGENMDLLKMFLNLLSSRTSYRDDQPAEFQIDDTYSVPVRPPHPTPPLVLHCGRSVARVTPSGVFSVSGSGNGGVWNHVTGAHTPERHHAAGTRPSGQLHIHRGQVNPPEEDAREGSAGGADGLVRPEEGRWAASGGRSHRSTRRL